jgi:hypothetical protein
MSTQTRLALPLFSQCVIHHDAGYTPVCSDVVTVLRRATKDDCIRSVVVDPMPVRGEREGVGETPMPTFRVPNRETDSHQIWFCSYTVSFLSHLVHQHNIS